MLTFGVKPARQSKVVNDVVRIPEVWGSSGYPLCRRPALRRKADVE
jgi:hypothetical protein